MKSAVISLRNAHDRRCHIQSEFTKKNIDFAFFDALTPDVAKLLAKKMNLIINEIFLTGGELACLMSHVSLWQRMIDENIPYMAIFEDDIYLGENADHYLNEHDWIKPEWHIIKLEAFNPRIFLSTEGVKLHSENRMLYKLRGKNLGTAGYILSQNGAQAYLQYVKSRPLIALDQMMFDDYIKDKKINVYQMSPAICIQEMMLFPEKKTVLSSDLVKERKARMHKYKKKGLKKIHLEIMRIINQITIKLYGHEVRFK